MTIDEVKYSIKNHILNTISHRDLCTLCNIFGIQVTSHHKVNQKNLLCKILVSTDLQLLRQSLIMLDTNTSVRDSTVPITPQIRYQPFAQNPNRYSQPNAPAAVLFSLNLRLYCLSNELLSKCPVDLKSEIVAGVNPQNIFVPNFTKYPNGYLNAPSSDPVLINGRMSIPSTPLPYVSKNTTVKASPFYCCQVVLHPLCLLIPKPTPNISQPNRIMAKMPLFFTISSSVRQLINAHRSQINNKPIYKWQVLLRFGVYDPVKPFPTASDDIASLEEYIPPYLSLFVNNAPVPLWEILPSNNIAKEGKRHSRPINITDYIKYNLADNQGYRQSINVNWWQTPGLYLYYYAAVFLERKLDVRELMNQFVKKTHPVQRPISFTLDFIREKFSNNNQFNKDDNDDDLIMSSVLPVSLLCPLGKSRITCPLRSLNCQHLQCFDAYLYLMMNERRSVWKCPVCDGQATAEELFVDEYFLHILRDFQHDEDITEVNVNPDGTYVPVALKESREEKQHVGNIITQSEIAVDRCDSANYLSNENSTESQPVILLESDDDDVESSAAIKTELISVAPIQPLCEGDTGSTNNVLTLARKNACTIDLTSDSEDDPKPMEVDETPSPIVSLNASHPSTNIVTVSTHTHRPINAQKVLPTYNSYQSVPIIKDHYSLAQNSFQLITNNNRLVLPNYRPQVMIPNQMAIHNQNYPYFNSKDVNVHKNIPQVSYTNTRPSFYHNIPSLRPPVSHHPITTAISAVLTNVAKKPPITKPKSPKKCIAANYSTSCRQSSKESSAQSMTSSSSSSSSLSSSEKKATRQILRGSRRSSRIQRQSEKKYFQTNSDCDSDTSHIRAHKKRKRDNPFDDSDSSHSDISKRKRTRLVREKSSDEEKDGGEIRAQSVTVDNISNGLKQPIICLTRLDPDILKRYF